MKPPFAYYGGKTTLAERIAAMLPDHGHYVEPFAGSLAVLLAKAPARHETVNDADALLMTFWRVLRDRPAELHRVCALTPHSRAEQQAAYRPCEHSTTAARELETARRAWVLLSQGRTGTLRRTGWRHFINPEGSPSSSMPGYLSGYLDRMPPAAARLARVSLECRPATDLIAAYGKAREALLYLDPPYLRSTRGGTNYRHEMPEPAEHEHLAELAHACAATVVLSGYPSPLYDLELYPDWYRYELPTGTGQGGSWGTRTEVLWTNRPLHTDTTGADLFTTAPFRYNAAAELVSGNENHCPQCGAVLRQPTHQGRRRRYCSVTCRVRAHRASATDPEEAA